MAKGHDHKRKLTIQERQARKKEKARAKALEQQVTPETGRL